MTDTFSLVPLREAVTSLGLAKLFGDRMSVSRLFDADENYDVRHYAGNASVSGDIDMDALANSGVAGIVVDGDFKLNGDIVNWEIDTTAAFLWVRGNLHCGNIIFGSMDLTVAQNVTASGLIVATYNHGHLLINGNVRADRVIIDDDGWSMIGGKVEAKGWNASPNAEVELRSSEWIDEIRSEFRDEFFDKEGYMKCGNGNVDLVKALLAGRDILREEKKPKAKAKRKQ